MEQENLDIKCLQLLRAIIHNEVVKLPDDWEENPLKHQRYKRHLARHYDANYYFKIKVSKKPYVTVTFHTQKVSTTLYSFRLYVFYNYLSRVVIFVI